MLAVAMEGVAAAVAVAHAVARRQRAMTRGRFAGRGILLFVAIYIAPRSSADIREREREARFARLLVRF